MLGIRTDGRHKLLGLIALLNILLQFVICVFFTNVVGFSTNHVLLPALKEETFKYAQAPETFNVGTKNEKI